MVSVASLQSQTAQTAPLACLSPGDEFIVTDANGVRCRAVVTRSLFPDRPMIVMHDGKLFYGHPHCHDHNHIRVGESFPIPYDEAVFLTLVTP